MHNVKMSKVITRYLQFIDELYQIIDKNVDKEKIYKEKLRQINLKYNKFCCDHGAEMKKKYSTSLEVKIIIIICMKMLIFR